MSKVSIILPIYNVSQYLHECLDSVVRQTLKDIEIICVNDGSTDDSLEIIKEYDAAGKYICAMCAAPVVLEKAGLLEGRKFTAYMGYDKKIKAGTFLEDKIVVDGNLVTSRGPATAYAFAYKLVDLLGGDSLAVKNRMVYFNAFDVKEDE